jgi:hypothetical protein
MGGQSSVYSVSVGKSEGNRPLIISRYRWEERILEKQGGARA